MTTANQPQRRTALFWLLMISFTLICLERAVTTPSVAMTPESIFSEASLSFTEKDYPKAAELFQSYLTKTANIEKEDKLEIYWKVAVSEEKSGNTSEAISWNQSILNDFKEIKDWKIHSARRALNRLAQSAP